MRSADTTRTLGVALVLALFPRAAAAYCWQTTTEFDTCQAGAGTPIEWPKHCMAYSINVAGTPDIPFETTRAAIRRSFDAWEDAAREGQDAPCTDFAFTETAPATCTRRGFDEEGGNVNLIIFREQGWEEIHGHDRAAIALTTIYFRENADIVSSDVEMNGEHYQFDVRDSYAGCNEEPGGCPTDFENTMTHEAGHTIGLAHAEDVEATMYFAEVPGDTDKRTLAPDDIEGMCDMYPVGEGESCNPDPPGGVDLACETNGGCCTAAPGVPSGRSTAVVASLAALAVAFLRRRR